MITLVLIHGFSGSPDSWRRIAPLLDTPSYVPAVRGHGRGGGDSAAVGRFADGAKASEAAAVSGAHGAADASVVCAFEVEVDRLAAEIAAAVPVPRYVAGYSLGGRLALGLLVRHPNLFVGAALIGANPGIGGEDERAARRETDEVWAQRIEERGLVAFDREWSDLPLFGSQRRLDADVLEEQRGVRLGHPPAALAAAMRALSLGAMPDYRPALPDITCPLNLIAGSRDSKFRALARQMAQSLPTATVHIVDDVGHNILLEAPAELVRLLNEGVADIDRR